MRNFWQNPMNQLAWVGERLQPWLALPGVRCALRWAIRLGLAAYFLFVALILVLRFAVLPQVAQHQAEIERAASTTVGMPVKIERIEAGWTGLNPRLSLEGVRLVDSAGLPALAFERVEGVLSWHSLWRFKPILALLAIDGPVLNIRRDTAGRITVAGMETAGNSDPRVLEWLLEQRRIRIRNAIIVWDDAKRGAPSLLLEDLHLSLDNRGDRHRFGLSALPPGHLAARIDLRGEIEGNPLTGWDKLSGRTYVELDYADLAGWRTWVDYPLALQRGRGAVRLWSAWEKGGGSLTADLALDDVQIRLGSKLPQLDLLNMRGRLEGSLRGSEWMVAGRQVELATQAGQRLPPTDFRAEWRQNREKWSGSASVSFVDLGTLEQLAAYLPLDARSRKLLATHQPRGRFSNFEAGWELAGETLERYRLSARFEEMGLRGAGYFPGGHGLSGALTANEKGGSLQIDSKTSGLDLPMVFPEPRLELAELRAKANWKVAGKAVDVRLERLEFAGADAAGSAQGSYRYDGEGPGNIDLTARLDRAEGKAVWRYMPHAVNADARAWLKRGIVAGKASEGKLTLRGDLRHFPFADKSKGEFLITAKAQGVRVDYAPGWPSIEEIDASLSFGVGMRVEASRGRILGASIGPVTAELPDFSAAEEMLLVKGLAEGPTAEFLKFIVQSPVAAKINRLTDDMRAQGNGRLALKLDMPLRHVNDTKVRGEFQFINNQVAAVPGLPPISQVNGRFDFNEDGVSAPEITGNVLGAPMKLTVANEGERVRVSMSGGAHVREMRKLFDSPLFDYVSGQTTWKGEIRVRKGTTEFVIESGLQGIASSLPEPFNKTAAAAMPLRLEKGLLPGEGPAREQLRIRLRNALEAQLVRRSASDGMQIERGAVAIGDTLPEMPARGVALAIRMARLDADFWRQALGSAASGAAGKHKSPLTRVTLNAPAMRLFGRDFNVVEASAVARDSGWQISLNAREAAGELNWQTVGRDLLKADLKRLSIPAEIAGGANSVAPQQESGEDLPGLDVRVQEFSLGEKRLGRLEAKARAASDRWVIESLILRNPDGALTANGDWKWRGGQHSHLEFELVARDIGKMLERWGHANVVRAGSAWLKGSLDWNGPLTSIHYPSLSGEFRLTAAKGQFAKIEPGLGKLLGLVSLQSLPRRLTLDFGDIFSDGLAFDSIEGKLSMRQGIMRTTENLRIDGPSARILMKGEADLKNETQNIEVTVQPEMGTVAAAGAAFVNPLLGAATLVASKLLQNPLNKLFSFQYRITGSWIDPKVEKIGQTVPAQPAIDAGIPAAKPAEDKK